MSADNAPKQVCREPGCEKFVATPGPLNPNGYICPQHRRLYEWAASGVLRRIESAPSPVWREPSTAESIANQQAFEAAYAEPAPLPAEAVLDDPLANLSPQELRDLEAFLDERRRHREASKGVSIGNYAVEPAPVAGDVKPGIRDLLRTQSHEEPVESLATYMQDWGEQVDDIREQAATVLPADWMHGGLAGAPNACEIVERLISELADRSEELANLKAEMRRYLPILNALECMPNIWAHCADGTGIATLNGYRHALAQPAAELS